MRMIEKHERDEYPVENLDQGLADIRTLLDYACSNIWADKKCRSTDCIECPIRKAYILNINAWNLIRKTVTGR